MRAFTLSLLALYASFLLTAGKPASTCAKLEREGKIAAATLQKCRIRTQKDVTNLNAQSFCQEEKFNDYQAAEKLKACHETYQPKKPI